MRGALFRPWLWVAGAVLALTLPDACNLNPQPLPPESDQSASGDDASAPNGGAGGPASSSGSTSNPSSGGAFTSSSGAGSGSGTSSGVATGSTADAGEPTVEQDAAASAEGGTSSPVDGGGADAGLETDGGPDSSRPDAALDGASTGDGGCVRQWDCYASHPGMCAICKWPLNYAVCVQGQCGCACDDRDAAGD